MIGPEIAAGQSELKYSYSEKKQAAGIVRNGYTTDSLSRPPLNADTLFAVKPESPLRVIVEYRAPSIARKAAVKGISLEKGKLRSPDLSRIQEKIESLHRRLSQDLIEIKEKIRKSGKFKNKLFQADIRRKYSMVFSGAALTVSHPLARNIGELSYVKRIYRDQVVKAVSDTVNELVGAEKLREQMRATGAGVDVAILDTGIDYLHPALGGGMGEDFKVKGGYDLVNRDDDPMDNNGHGTMVAGILAAEGEVTGVAPGVNLYAYKVLNGNAIGRSSYVISGIERAVKQGVDVINMSLGGSGNSSDPLSKAANNAVRAGISVVTSAGNDGNRYWTMQAPGSASLAITVGASTKGDEVAWFSSRGPTDETYAIKPDIVAPGVDIRTTTLDNSYTSPNGTSLSAPVVAGTAALLYELHPNESPRVIKARILQTGKDLGYDIWSQGHGRVQAYKAHKQQLVSTPSHISFGLVPSESDQWTQRDTLKFHNLSSETQRITLSNSKMLPSGIQLYMTPSQLELAANNTSKVVIKVSVNNDEVDYPKKPPLDYSGAIMAVSRNDTVRIPWSLLKIPHLTVVTSHNGNVRLHAHKSEEAGAVESVRIRSLASQKIHTWRFMENADYNIIAEYMGEYFYGVAMDDYKLVIKEHVNTAQTDTVRISVDQATNKIVLKARDEKGRRLERENLVSAPKHFSHETGYSIFRSDDIDSFYVSDFNTNYTLKGFTQYRRISNKTADKNPVIHDYVTNYFRIEHLTEDRSIEINPSAYKQTAYEIIGYPGPGFKSGLRFRVRTDFNFDPLLPSVSSSDNITGQKTYVLHFLPNGLKPRYEATEYKTGKRVYISGNHRVSQDDSIIFKRGSYSYRWPYDTNKEFSIPVGGVVPFFSAGINHEMIWTGTDRGFFHDAFGAIMTNPGLLVSGRLFINYHRNGSVINQTQIDKSPFKRTKISIPDPQKGDWIQFGFKSDKYFLEDTVGRPRARYYFGGSNSGTGPKISLLRFSSAGQPTNKFRFNRVNRIDLRVNQKYESIRKHMAPFNQVDSIRMFVRPTQKKEWTRLKVKSDVKRMRARIEGLETSYYDFKTSITDKKGNTLVYQASPAFKYISSRLRVKFGSVAEPQNTRFVAPLNTTELLGNFDINQYSFTLTYDPSLLDFIKVQTNESLSHGASYKVPKDTAGVVSISVKTSRPVRGTASPLLNLVFKTLNQAGTTSLNIKSFYLNQLEMNVVSDPNTVRVLPVQLGDVSMNGKVSAYDASLVLHSVLRDTVLTSLGNTAANVSTDNAISTHDVSMILEYVTRERSHFPTKQLMDSRTRSQVRTAVNKTNSEGYSLLKFGDTQVVSSTGAGGERRSVVRLPLLLKRTKQIRSLQSTINFHSDQIELKQVEMEEQDGWMNHYNLDEKQNQLHIAFAGVNELAESKVAVLEFSVNDSIDAAADLSLAGMAQMNERKAQPIKSIQLLDIPKEMMLQQNYPNPFNPTTKIKYGIAEKTPVRISVYTIQGRKVADLVDKIQIPGTYTVKFNAGGLSSGVYLYTLHTLSGIRTNKMILLK